MNKQLTNIKSHLGRWGVIGIPYFWLLLFFLIPFAIVFKISFAEILIAQPPFSDLFELKDSVLTATLQLENYTGLITDNLYFDAYLESIRIAFFSTVFCLLIGYPIAYAISRSDPSKRNTLLILLMLPSWTSFLIRIYAWIGILKPEGYINALLMWLGLIDAPLTMLRTDGAVYVGIIYAYLPFMVLPIYTNLTKLDPSLLEVASDLGARPWTTFFSVVLPLSKAGIIAGSMLVFIPALGEFVIPALLGGPDTLMIGKVLWDEFFNNRSWPVASAVAIVMLGILIFPITLFHHYQSKEMEGV